MMPKEMAQILIVIATMCIGFSAGALKAGEVNLPNVRF
jgi:hypothetical protein